jgi:hypothetical protein
MRRNFRIAIKGEEPLAELAERVASQMKKAKPGQYRIIIESVGQDRTDAQNRFYWAVLNEIAKQTGTDNEDLHEHFKARFLQDHSVRPARIKSTAELDVREFTHYIDRILSFIADFGVTITQTREF